MIKMIALDLDGTLAVENHQVLPATRDALQVLHDGEDVEVVIATGRRYRTTRYVIDNLGFDVYVVCAGGALVKTPDQQTLHREAMDIRPILAEARARGLTVFGQRDSNDLGGPDFIIDTGTDWNQVTQDYYRDNTEWSGKGDLATLGEEFLMCGIFASEEEISDLATALATSHPEYQTISVLQQGGHHYCEIAMNHVDKWHGLSKLMEHLHIEPEEICAVGDQVNDLAMLSAAGHGVAMANGHEDLQAIATFVCGHNQEDGILDVTEYIHRINGSTV